MTLTKREGLEIAIKQIAWSVRGMSYEEYEKFLPKVTKMVLDGYEVAKDGFDVPRGVNIEWLMFEAKGRTKEEYADYLKSMD